LISHVTIAQRIGEYFAEGVSFFEGAKSIKI
jgi:hypothetical protein